MTDRTFTFAVLWLVGWAMIAAAPTAAPTGGAVWLGGAVLGAALVVLRCEG